MADTIQTLLVSLEARIAGYEREMKRAVGVSNRSAKGIEDRFKRMNSAVGASFGRIGALLATGLSTQAFIKFTDAANRIENSLKSAGLAGEDLERVYSSLRSSALSNAAPIEDLVILYNRASLAQKELGVSTDQLLSFTDNVALALRASGQSAAESSGALLQLSQALGAGTVRAEEFNSILEGAPTIARAVAAGLAEAGGSVATLRSLVIDGKISSETFFNAFQAGATILQDQVASSVLTLSQRFENLNTALIDSAGRIDGVTGASNLLGAAIDYVARASENAATDVENWASFLQSLKDNARDAGEAVAEIPESPLDGLIAEAETANQALFDLEGQMREIAVDQAELFPEDVRARVQDIISKFQAATLTASETTAALHELGGVDADFAPYIGQLDGIINAMAVAAAQARYLNSQIATPSGPVNSRSAVGAAMRRRYPKAAAQVSIEDAPALGAGKGSGQSPGEKFDDILKRQAEENRLLAEKTALQATLNPLVNDYDEALTKLQVTQELQSAATAAGIELTPELRETIEDLATGYATATVEAAKLAEAQESARESMRTWFDLGKSATRGFIDDLVEGKDAAEALGNVFNKLGDQLLNMGLSALFGGGAGGGFGLLGKAFGFAGGGYTGNGGKYEPAGVVHRGEYVFTKEQTAKLGAGNLAALAKGYANGGLVGAPAPMSRAANDNVSVPVSISIDARGADADGLARVEQRLAALQAELPGQVKNIVRTKGTKWR